MFTWIDFFFDIDLTPFCLLRANKKGPRHNGGAPAPSEQMLNETRDPDALRQKPGVWVRVFDSIRFSSKQNTPGSMT